MPMDVRSAIPAASSRAVAFRAGRGRLVWWLTTTVEVLTVTVTVLAASLVAVVLGMS